MKTIKSFCLLFALMLAFTMSGCAKSQSTPTTDVISGSKSVSGAQNSQTNSEITQEKAAALLEDYLKTIGVSKDDDPNLVISLDHTDEADGKDYYVFQVFDNMEDHTATIGWYGVQKEDGSLYDFVLMKTIATDSDTSNS